ncbi:MAG: type III-B CRISPR module RAMP protein Cmr1 [Nitrospirae bacterium CG_4_10_14_0_8_um_filter_41_23]|nr:type III-B CRISPR module RAMP protein Cmr1 [Nitrospirota bacterium]OIP58614.1 MAG: type III-B CRISPR module RAMP protein Cmr1 [Nitrospirae bacterium CG2_30_41_42]PIQ94879.1 MAG: type III-B CRISPR module RAMP protein Cmr1 [Nitrospirae bacterium CG11_big_fil_rev_8_21_14_0_20_41_14]PIV44034.1 MAG: type III-B CRISPR module RAMP protein Cmr1 [Nitrospirae bacterium CG02_land_8_20_14_3_00_41_53]PIW87526.1 MAG: type III-B CRISPR module RAMP protein Cmr1 [Nitrospirae bacterium CG_4_8_14_3_um_filter_4
MAVDIIQFKIRFITPLLIHGANSREADSIGLTGKALRGCWRFWFRAMVGGQLLDINDEPLAELENKLLGLSNEKLARQQRLTQILQFFESKIFGSSDEKFGAKFRLVITPPESLKPNDKIYPGFNRKLNSGEMFRFKGFSEGCEFIIRILTRENMNSHEINILLSSIWLWANLGGIGQRARRGFGSAVIDSISGTDAYIKPDLFVTPQFSESDQIKDYLCNGLSRIWMVFEQWLKDNGCRVVGDIATNPEPKDSSFFILNSLSQIAIGGKPYYGKLDDAVKAVHGKNECTSLGWANGGRMASPVITRFHKVSQRNHDSLVPVVTWCHQKLGSKSIPHADCLKAYLKNGICNCGKNFSTSYCNVSSRLSGDAI